MVRAWPNIVITGTPGTGKSTLASILAKGDESTRSNAVAQHLNHINVSTLVRQRKEWQLSYDAEWDAFDPNEDAILDELEPKSGGTAPDPASQPPEDAEGGGLLLDWHTNEVWPERWVDLVVVLRTDHSLLWKRLEKRGYATNKIQENNEAEILQTVLEEARNSYPAEAIVELPSDSNEQLEENAERIVQWILQWRRERGFPEIA